MMPQAGYDWGCTDEVVWIIDQDNGKKSVTNDIENIVANLIGKTKHSGTFEDRITKEDYFIYRDSEGNWDGWDHVRKRFIPLQVRSRGEASLLIKQKFLPL